MTQQKIDDLFFSPTSSSSTRSGKRSRLNQTTTNDRDEFDDLFETNSSAKRRRTNNPTKQSTDVFDFDEPSTSTNIIKKIENEKSVGSLKKKRSFTDHHEHTAIDELFSNDTRKKLRRPIKTEESNTDILDMLKTRTNANVPQIISTIDDFKTPTIIQKKIKMFFDDADLISSHDQLNDIKDYVHVKPVLVTGGQWLSKEAETKSTCETIESTDNSTGNISDDQRNLMHIQYAPLIIDDQIDNSKKSKSKSQTPKSSNKKLIDGKSFQKQLVLSDSTVLRKENLQSCYNALLEDINKPRLPASKKSTRSKSDDIEISDDEQINNIDFFDLPTRKKKF